VNQVGMLVLNLIAHYQYIRWRMKASVAFLRKEIMKNPFRNISMLYKRKFGSGITKIDEILVDVDQISSKTVQNLLYKGIYESDERRLLKKICGRSDTVLEIGAGIGVIGLVAARLCSDGKVYSYEANPKMRSIIEKNYSLNSLVPELKMMPITLKGDLLDFFICDNIISSSSFSRTDESFELQTLESIAIDDAIRIHNPNLVVMDVEGYEQVLVKGADWSNVEKILIEFHPQITGMDIVEDLKAHLVKIGYKEHSSAGNNVAFFRQ
jgi:FkbM family methyltransferase